MLNVLDTSAKECVAIEVDVSLGGDRVARVLERLGAGRSLPHTSVVDNRPGFHSKALDAWAQTRGVHLQFIRPGKPVEYAYSEAFNSRVRDECLNRHWFPNRSEARRILERWRISYNTGRPHRALDLLTPQQFAESHEESSATQLSA